jgi:hypothetical protein
MKSLFEKEAEEEISNRINKLSVDSKRLWGKMDVAQMLAHCAITMEMATGAKKLSRLFIGRILGPLVKSSYLGPKPLSKNSPTDKNFIISDPHDFEFEKKRLLLLVKQFSEGGAANCTTHPHSFFGKFTPNEWGISTFKHLDHHLRQFGV